MTEAMTMTDAHIIKEYRRLRAKNWKSVEAMRAARVKDEFQNLGMYVRFVVEADDELYDDSYIDEVTFPNGKKELWSRIGMEGVWGLVGKYRASEDEPWEVADSVWGFIGDDWEDSGYDIDIKENTIKALHQAWQRKADELSERATYAAGGGE